MLANLAVAAAKTAGAAVSGSASLAAEAAHSWADTGNQAFLMVANRRSARPADADRPLGYGREAYVWSLLAAVGLFVVGGTASVWHGVAELTGPDTRPENYAVAYSVLAVALVMESLSLMRAVRQLRAEARSFEREMLEHAMLTSDPTVRAVFAEDCAALAGILLALCGIGLHQFTGAAAWDAVGSILVGVLLGAVAVILIDRNRRFLTGEPAAGQLRTSVLDRIRALPEVAGVQFLRVVFVGPRQLFVVAGIDLLGDRPESALAQTLRRLERRLEESPYIIDAVLTVAAPTMR